MRQNLLRPTTRNRPTSKRRKSSLRVGWWYTLLRMSTAPATPTGKSRRSRRPSASPGIEGFYNGASYTQSVHVSSEAALAKIVTTEPQEGHLTPDWWGAGATTGAASIPMIPTATDPVSISKTLAMALEASATTPRPASLTGGAPHFVGDPRQASPANAKAAALAPEVLFANLRPENNNQRYATKTDREMVAEILARSEKEKARERKMEMNGAEIGSASTLPATDGRRRRHSMSGGTVQRQRAATERTPIGEYRRRRHSMSGGTELQRQGVAVDLW